MQVETKQQEIKPIASRQLHRYILTFVGVFLLAAISYPIALLRVSQSEKFAGFHVKSLTLEGKLETQSAKK